MTRRFEELSTEDVTPELHRIQVSVTLVLEGASAVAPVQIRVQFPPASVNWDGDAGLRFEEPRIHYDQASERLHGGVDGRTDTWERDRHRASTTSALVSL